MGENSVNSQAFIYLFFVSPSQNFQMHRAETIGAKGAAACWPGSPGEPRHPAWNTNWEREPDKAERGLTLLTSALLQFKRVSERAGEVRREGSRPRLGRLSLLGSTGTIHQGAPHESLPHRRTLESITGCVNES